MNHQGQRWNVHYVANVGLRKRLNLCKRGFKIYDLLVSHKEANRFSKQGSTRTILLEIVPSKQSSCSFSWDNNK